MKQFRMNRLFNQKSMHCLDVAIDHGFFGEFPFLEGIENIAEAVEVIASAAPDAIQLTVGQATHLQSMPGRHKPSLVLRTDIANVFGNSADLAEASLKSNGPPVVKPSTISEKTNN